MQRLASLLAVAANVVTAKPGFLFYSDVAGSPYTVTYDNRSIIVAGERTLFASAGIHYPRFTPGQWDDVILKAKADGYNMIQTYVFVNAHMPKQSVWPWNMEGPSNLRLFIAKVKAAGLFLNLRIGPYVCAEWSWGGYPYDLAQIPGVTTRSSNAAWESWMRTFLLNVTREFRDEFADRGGPIVLAQVENELHTNDQAYIDFCGQLAEETGTGIPWEMCNGASANTTINSCNGGDCTSFIEEHGQNGRVLITEPALWTENWMGWFASWGDGGPAGNWPSYDSTSQSESKSAGLLRWYGRGGSHVNQYNWAGGNHFARNAGSSMVGIYYWDAPIASDNLAQGPERLHIARTNAALVSVAPALLAAPAQLHHQVQLPYFNAKGVLQPTDASHYAFIYPATDVLPPVAFIENHGSSTATFVWAGFNFTVNQNAVLLAFGNGTTVFASNDVTPTGTTHTWMPVTGALGAWSTWQDPLVPATASEVPPPTPPRTPWVGSALGTVVTSPTPLEAVAFSEYDSELTLYVTQLSPDTISAAITACGNASAVPLTLASAVAQAWSAFADGALIGSGWELSHADGSRTWTFPLDLSVAAASGAPVTLSLLSSSLGIGNGGGVHNGSSTGVKGITSSAQRSVVLGSASAKSGGVDITAASPWTHVAGSVGEARAVYTPAGAAGETWTPLTGLSTPPLTWLRTTFTAPPAVLTPPAGVEVAVTLNLDVTGLSRGRFFINGMDMGRFWSKLCGSTFMCQRFYPVPFDLLLPGPGANTLFLLDELGVNNASAIAFAISANTAPPPPPPCPAPAAEGGPVGLYSCASNGVAWTAGAPVGGLVPLSFSRSPGLCLDATAAVKGGSVTLAPCVAGAPAQLWALPSGAGGAAVTNGAGGAKCLDVFGQNTSVAAPLDLWGCNGGSNQLWVWDAAGGHLRTQLDSFARTISLNADQHIHQLISGGTHHNQMRNVLLLVLLRRVTLADDVTVDCSSTLPLDPFWRSVGMTPAEYGLRDDEHENVAQVGAVPNRGVVQVRTHYLFDLVMVTGFANSSDTPSGSVLSYEFGRLDHVLDLFAGSNLVPGFELMGSPSGLPTLPSSFWLPYNGNGHIYPAQTFSLWRQLVADTIARCVSRYGAASVSSWLFESWNEPDSGWGWPAPPSGPDDPALAAYVLYWDATAAGVADAENATGIKLRFGGTASGKAARDAWYLPALLDHKVSGVNAFTGAPVRWDFVSAHIKGDSTSYVTVQGEWAVSALFRSKPEWAAAMDGLSVSNDEGDPMVGWEKPVPWRGDARYSSIMPKMVNQHLLAIRDNATSNNPLGILSFDGLFLNGVDDSYIGFGERTMTARFGAPLNTAPFALVRKNGLAAFTLLSMLGDVRCAYTGATGAADVLTANTGVLATARAGEAAVLVYNSADCTDDTSPAVSVGINVTGLDLAPAPADGSVVAVLYAINDASANCSPVLAWQALGSPTTPTTVQLQTLWAASACMTAATGAPVPVSVGAGGSLTLPRITVPLPGVALWHVAARAAAPISPAAPKGVSAWIKPPAESFVDGGRQEVFVRWNCSSVSRVLSRYAIDYSADGTTSGGWVTINAHPWPADVMCSFSHIAPSGDAFYRVTATDYWGRTGEPSAVVAAVAWPSYEDHR